MYYYYFTSAWLCPLGAFDHHTFIHLTEASHLRATVHMSLVSTLGAGGHTVENTPTQSYFLERTQQRAHYTALLIHNLCTDQQEYRTVNNFRGTSQFHT